MMMRMVSAGLLAGLLALAVNGTAWAAGDAVSGQKLFKKCSACHSVKEGKKLVGPSLYKIYGATPGQVAKFRYSKGMVAYGQTGVVWDDDTLDAAFSQVDDLLTRRRTVLDQEYAPKSLATAASMLPEARWTLISV